jgi:hypothetical protein
LKQKEGRKKVSVVQHRTEASNAHEQIEDLPFKHRVRVKPESTELSSGVCRPITYKPAAPWLLVREYLEEGGRNISEYITDIPLYRLSKITINLKHNSA